MPITHGISRRELLIGSAVALTISAQTPLPTIDDFFREITNDWVRHDPSLATRAHYFEGDEQDRLSRQLTPRTLEWRRDRITRARKGLTDLRKFDRTRMSEVQRVSADLLDWQLDVVVQEEPYLDYTYPLEQMNGANVNLVEVLTVSYPVSNERDAENYLAALSQASTRLDESISDAKRLASKKVIPPRFILNATVKQMQGFVDSAPAQNPFVTAYLEKLNAIKGLPDARRESLRAEAEKIVAAQIYPAWNRGISLLRSQIPASTDDAGLWHLQGGDAAYAYFLRRFTTALHGTSLEAQR